jgi:beta-glucanase (GH16 family)
MTHALVLLTSLATSFAIGASAPVLAQDVTLFAEEFNGEELDRERWNVMGPSFGVNNEQQAYIDSEQTIRLLPPGEVEGADGGVLELRAIYRPGFETPTGRVADFVSGRINTRDNFDFTYGRAEARIRMPAAAGIWPAFWMLGNGQWPDTGEIDIMEYLGEPDWTAVALHGPGYSGDTPIVSRNLFPEGEDVTGWHVYAAEWDANTIEFFVDDRLVYRVTRSMVEAYGEWRFDTPKFLILNLALGGTYPFSVNGVEEPYNGLPARTVEQIQSEGISIHVDWVRVTQPAELDRNDR